MLISNSTRALELLLAIAVVLCAASTLPAQNGAVDWSTDLCGVAGQSTGIDLAFDTSTNTVWVLDERSGQVCQYTLAAFPPDIAFAQTVSHPAGAAGNTPPFLPVGRGLAYDPFAQHLLVLVFGDTTSSPPIPTPQIRRMDTTGVEQGIPVNLVLPPGVSVYGLAFDTVTGNVWTRDVVNHRALQINPLNGQIVSTLDLPGEAVMYGKGIAFVSAGGQRTLEYTRGGVLDYGPVEMIRIDASSGAELCADVDLSQVPEEVIGILRPPTGTVIYATGETQIHKIDATLPAVIPPADMSCLNNTDGTIRLDWRNCGPGLGGAYDSIRITRNGNVYQIISGSMTAYTDLNPLPPGSVVQYGAVGVVGATLANTTCSLQTGAGGLIDYAIFDGVRPYDIALDANAGELYVTDNGGTRIYVYNTSLSLVRILDTGLPGLQGIAYNTMTNQVVVTRFNSVNLTRIDPFTGTVGSSTPLGSGTNAVALTYDAINDDYLYVDAASSPTQVVRINAEIGSVGQLLGTYSPPIVTGLQLGPGISHLEASDTFIHPIINSTTSSLISSISEVFPNGFPSGLNFPTNALGAATDTVPNAIRGIEDIANIIYVASPPTRAIFRMLIAPGGNDFLRADVNQDTVVNLADVLAVADYIFLSGPTPPCLDAADVNDSGNIDISDPLYLLFYLFSSGAPIPAPFPSPGPDPTFQDPFTC
ncbi:MAG: dockerin type I domain-containing protein [Planctomycetota bacterium]|jgi:DNA-binding beta-propeller fold protein YncE